MPRVEKKKFTKEYRLKEIQKNLIKKARLKKEYFKALKEEGYSVPEKEKSEKHDRASVDAKKEHNKRKVKEQKDQHKQRKREQREKELSHKEHEIMRIQNMKQKEVQREERAKRLTKRTRTGQPVMGPRINDLLEKIKNDETYTK